MIASAGNIATNFDVARELTHLPAQSQHVISVAATGPVGWAYRGATNFYEPAYYTNHGRSLVDLAAPGGNGALFVIEGVTESCDVGGFVRRCDIFDWYLSTNRGTTEDGSWSWGQGTSMAAPTVAGVAALIIERTGSSHPAQVRTRLQQSALDLGAPGFDPWYGHGWVNAYRAVQ